jgi:hypothetical protein
MPRPPKILNANDGLLSFVLLNDFAELIYSPKEWIAKSRLNKLSHINALKEANGDLISDIANAPNLGKPMTEKKAKMQSITAQMKSNMNLEKKNWAITFYLHQRSKGKITKAKVAEEIRALLVENFPEDVPQGNAMGVGNIPTAKTIETEWLKEKLS